MQLYLKQRIFTWFDSFDIYHEDGSVAYTVQGQLSWGHKLEVQDDEGRYLGMVRQLQKYYAHKHYFGVDLEGNPDFSKIAEAYDMAYYRVEKPEDIEPALTAAIDNKRLTLVECMIDREEMVYPMVLNGSGVDEMVVAGRLDKKAAEINHDK